MYLFNVLNHDVFDLSNPAAHSADGVCIWVICKVAHALLQHSAEFCVELVCDGILSCFWAICAQKLLFDVVQKGKRYSAAQCL